MLGNKVIRFIFFGNYFVGLLAVALNLEAIAQLNLPYNSITYYALLFLAPIIYYTYAYNTATVSTSETNLRTKWYFENKKFIGYSQAVLFVICLSLSFYFLYHNFHHIVNLPFSYWLAIFIIIFAGGFYYGLLPRSFLKFNLRNTGWLKAFVIGFVWACCANVLPLIFLKIELNVSSLNFLLWTWLFIKNWMFCTVNAIIFDIKDYPTDANKQLRTFVVRFGLRKTIFYILIPLVIIGLTSMFTFAYFMHFKLPMLFFNVLPFLLTIYVAYNMHKRKNILFYLIVIDGLILFKALCGLLGMQFL